MLRAFLVLIFIWPGTAAGNALHSYDTPRWTYTPDGDVETHTDANGQTRSIDALDRIQSVRAPGRGAVQYSYSPAGRVQQIDHPDGTRTEQSYDAAGRIASIAHFRGGRREAFYQYDYDENGNRIDQIEDLGTGEVQTGYVYDTDDRLIETERAGRITTYILDAVGNRIEEEVTEGALTAGKTFEYNERDQLEQIWIDGVLDAEYVYDANGNRITSTTGGVTRHFTFGARDRLKSLHLQGGPPEVEWQYDDGGFRVSETSASEARRFRWDGETLAFEANVLGNILARYDHGPDRILAETEGTQTRTWLTNALRTPVKRLDEVGVYSVTRYDEFGKVEEESSPDVPRFGFTGHQRGPSQEPDLYYAQQRWYNAGTGRFLSEDPLWGQPETPMSRHRYLYAYANPTVYIDPDGRAVILSDTAHFFERRRVEATEAAVAIGHSEMAQSGTVRGDVTARAGTILTSLGAGIFGAAEYTTRTANFGANLVGERIGFISDKSVAELDQTFRTLEGVASGTAALGRQAWNDPIDLGRRGAGAVSTFGHAVFIEGDPNAQAQLGAGIGEVFAGGAIARSGAIASRQGLSAADAGIRQAGQSAADTFETMLERAVAHTPTRPRFVAEGASGNATFSPRDLSQIIERSRAASGDASAATRLIDAGQVEGLRLNSAGQIIDSTTGRYVSHVDAMKRAGQLLPIRTTQLVDSSAMPVIDGGSMTRMSPRTRSGAYVERSLHVMDRLNEDAKLRESIKYAIEQLEHVQ